MSRPSLTHAPTIPHIAAQRKGYWAPRPKWRRGQNLASGTAARRRLGLLRVSIARHREGTVASECGLDSRASTPRQRPTRLTPPRRLEDRHTCFADSLAQFAPHTPITTCQRRLATKTVATGDASSIVIRGSMKRLAPRCSGSAWRRIALVRSTAASLGISVLRPVGPRPIPRRLAISYQLCWIG